MRAFDWQLVNKTHVDSNQTLCVSSQPPFSVLTNSASIVISAVSDAQRSCTFVVGEELKWAVLMRSESFLFSLQVGRCVDARLQMHGAGGLLF